MWPSTTARSSLPQAVLWTTGVRVSPIAAAAGLEVDDRGRIVTDESLRSVSHPNVYAVGDAAAIRQGYGVMHGTCQSGIPTAVHAATSIVRELKGKQPKKFRFGYVHQPVSLGRHDAVIQFTHADDSPGRFYLAGRMAVGVQRDGERQPVDHIPAAQGAARTRGGDVAARRPVNTMNADQQTFADHRNLLFSIAYRILGSAADAEDVVQDAWFKWSADDRSQVSDPKAYLARIVSNLSMERLRSTRHQRETYVGPWLPEPILTETDAADDVAAAESVSMAMLVVLETLSPHRTCGVRAEGGVRLQLRRNRRSRRAFRVGGAPGGPPRTGARTGAAAAVRGRPHQEARSHRAVLRRDHRRRHQRADGTARAGGHAVDRRRRQGATGDAPRHRRGERGPMDRRARSSGPTRASKSLI